MANQEDRLQENVPGRYYVDSSCIDCDQCREYAPAFFRKSTDMDQSFVFRQPLTNAEIKVCEEAMEGCPTESIGNDGEQS
ncbi:MAG: ferredoxin [Verrucomicrobiaceae bacterium]|nr:ferredoxin [Verrucomicrobiaceae bacterium]